MEPNCVATRTPGSSILDDVAPLAGGKYAKTEARQFVVPKDVVLLPDISGIDDPFGELRHGAPPIWPRFLA